MNWKIILLAICLSCFHSLTHGQNPVPQNTPPNAQRDLPKLNENDVQGEVRQNILRKFCRKTAECEGFRVIKIEQTPLLETSVYLITKANHSSAYALQYRNKFYTSTNKNDFEKFLKNYRILAQANFSDAFLDVYRYFRFNDAAINPFYIVDAVYLTKNADNLKRYESGYEKIAFQLIHPPKMTKTHNGGVEIDFYADSPLSAKLLKIAVTISPKYRVQEKSALYRIEAPIEIK